MDKSLKNKNPCTNKYNMSLLDLIKFALRSKHKAFSLKKLIMTEQKKGTNIKPLINPHP